MAQIQITVNGRAYLVACDDGQETHVARLGEYLDRKVMGLAKDVGQVGDARLLLMAGLLVADELSERAGGPALAAAAAPNGAAIDEAALVETLNGLAERIEAIVVALERD